MIKLDKNGLTAPSITTSSITAGDTTVTNFNQFVVKDENGEIEETLYLKGHINPAGYRDEKYFNIGYEISSRTGASLSLTGADSIDETGSFILSAIDEENDASLRGYPDGTLSWDTFTFSTSYGSDCSYIRFSASDFMIQASGKESARLGLRGENNGGSFSITAKNSNATKSLSGYPDGTLTWNGSKVITNSSLTDLENNLYFADNSTSRGVGYKGYEGARIAFYSANNSNDSDKGRFAIAAQKDADNAKYLVGKPDGTLTWNGSNIVTYGLLNRLETSIVWSTDNSRTSGTVGFNSTDGAKLIFYNKNHTTYTGYFQLVASDGSTNVSFVGKPNGELTWNGQSLITNYNKTHIYFDHSVATSRDIGFSTSNNNTKRGAYITLKSGGDTSAAGCFNITARDANNLVTLVGKPNGELTWNGGYITPIGAIAAYAGTSVPAGWLYCNGGAVSRTTYAALFNAIGTKYGTGDGSTTFNLPALQGRVLQGYTDSDGIGTKIAAGLPDIQGSVNLSAGNTGSRLGLIRSASGAFASSKAAQKNPSSVGDLSGVYEEFTFKASSYNSVYGKTTSAVQPAALAIMYIIKYK